MRSFVLRTGLVLVLPLLAGGCASLAPQPRDPEMRVGRDSCKKRPKVT